MPVLQVASDAYGGVAGVTLYKGALYDFSQAEADRGTELGALVRPGRSSGNGAVLGEATSAPVPLGQPVEQGPTVPVGHEVVGHAAMPASEAVGRLAEHPEEIDEIEAAELSRDRPRSTVLAAIASLRSP